MGKKMHSYRGHKNVNIKIQYIRIIITYINQIFKDKNIINNKHIKYIFTIVNLRA